MKIVGKIPDTYVIDPSLAFLQGVEKRCASCKKRWEDGEKVVIFATSVIQDDKIALPDDSIHIVHLSPCLEEFVGIIMASLPKLEVEKFTVDDGSKLPVV
jgi:hypothetical protein